MVPPPSSVALGQPHRCCCCFVVGLAPRVCTYAGPRSTPLSSPPGPWFLAPPPLVVPARPSAQAASSLSRLAPRSGLARSCGSAAVCRSARCLPVPELGLGDDVEDLLTLASRQCRRRSPVATAEQELKVSVLALIQEVEREIVPERERLEGILEEVGINDPTSCSDEIEILERDIGDRVAERWTSAMIALVGLLRYAKCVLFSAVTPRPLDSKVDLDDDGAEPLAPPPDFRCPISLDLMSDSVVVASSQTYDLKSITQWFGSTKSTCPKMGQVLANLELVSNKVLENLISRWCRENDIAMEGGEPGKSEPAPVVTANKAALEAVRMTALFLVKKLSVSFSPDAANRVVHEIRQLAKSGSDNCAFIGEASVVPLLVSLLHSEVAALQLNAVTALLNLSILKANKKRVMHAEGAVEALCHVRGSGATWRAKDNAAAIVLSLAALHSYRCRLGRNPRVVKRVVLLMRTGFYVA